MESRDRRRTREHTNSDKNRKKTSRDKPPQEHQDKDSTLPVDTETATTSTYPEDSEYSERMQQRIEQRRLKEKSHHKTNQEQRNNNQEQKNNNQEQKNNNQEQKNNNQEQKNTQDIQVQKSDENDGNDRSEKSEKEKQPHGKHEKLQNDEIDKKRTKHKSEHRSKEHREHREARRERHQSPSKHRSEEKRNREGHDGHHKSREAYYIKSKSIAEKIDQLENSEEDEDTDDKNTEADNTSKQCVQKENTDREDEEGDNNSLKHNQKREDNADRKNEDVEDGKQARTTKRHHSVKGKANLRDKLKRTIPENREHVVRRSDESEHKNRQRKRTESHRERKKEKSCKKCKKHICKSDPHRAYYSDSELDCGNGASRTKSFDGHSARYEPPLDVNAMYHAFTHTGRSKTYAEESEKNKDSMKQKLQHTKKSEALLCEKCKKGSKPAKRTRSPTEQTSIRSKLITALFQRIKALLKETEELRQERNELREKLTTLSKEYETLREKEDLNSEQEQLMKEKIETLAGDIRIPHKGTFREEVHQILQNIQRKYQTHWKEHEHKINQVQTDAENEIQSLMRNIVTKYVEIGEIKDRNEMATNMLQSKNMAEPLYISTKTNSNPDLATTRHQAVGIYERYYPNTVQSKNELLLKVADPTKPRSSNQHPTLQSLCRENVLKSSSQAPIFRQGNPIVDLNIERPPRELPNQRETTMIPKFLYTNSSKYQFATTETLSSQNNGTKTEQVKEKLPAVTIPEEIKVHFHPTTTSEEVMAASYRTKKLFPTENKPITENISKPIEQGLLTKKDTREFWRQKLSQPALDSCKENVDNHRPVENKRNVN